ncbi:MAG: tripartite tricarboxylate transporter substrate binding protein [Pseudomonadota bacterium]
MRFTSNMFSTIVLAAVAGTLAPLVAVAGAYPEKAIQIVVPFPPGGAGDIMGRLLAKQLAPSLGQPVVVENKPGAGTIVGAQYVANAKPDGYTLLLSSNSTFSVNPAIMAKLPYNPETSFEPVGMVSRAALVLVSNPSTKFTSLAQIIAAAKASPGNLSFATPGSGTVFHFAGEMFNYQAGIKMLHVPYRGSAPAITDLIGGQVPLMYDTVVSATPQIKAGKVVPIAVTTAKRSALLPNVPTIAESGFPGFEMSSWITLVLPKGAPPEVRSKLEKALASALSSTEFKDKLLAAGFEPAYSPMKNWSEYVSKDIASLRAIATRAQIRVE